MIKDKSLSPSSYLSPLFPRIQAPTRCSTGPLYPIEILSIHVTVIKKGEGLSPCHFPLIFSPSPLPISCRFSQLKCPLLPLAVSYLLLLFSSSALFALISSNQAVDSQFSVEESKVHRADFDILTL